MITEEKAVISSVIITVCMFIGLAILSEKLGFTFFYDYGETKIIDHGIWDEEKSEGITHIGWYTIIISIMVGWRLKHWMTSGKISGNLKYSSSLTWKYVFIGLTIVTVLTEIIYMFDFHYLIINFSPYVILIITAWLLLRRYDNKVDKHYKTGKYYEKKITEAQKEMN